MENTVTVHDKTFRVCINSTQIAQAVERVANELSDKIADSNPLFICLLNGSYVFAADLMRALPFNAEISFVKVASYSGMQSTGNMDSLIGLAEDISNRTVVLVEDIIDSGNTMDHILKDLQSKGATDIHIATMLFKPNAFKHSFPIEHIGFEIENDFVVGYGMDYDGLGRNLKDIYQLI